MLKKLARYLKKQKMLPWIGEFKETLAQALFWGSILNWVMVAGTFYYTTLRNVVPWFSLGWFVTIIVVGVVVIFFIEYKFIVPSIWAFRGKQMDLRNGKPIEPVKLVAVSGGFDPLNGRGHITHMQEARKLGNRLVVILSRDDQLIAKGNKPVGTFYPDIGERAEIIRALECVDDVFVNIDTDGTCAESLRAVRPQIFAKGGDRTPVNMPKCEIDVCKEIGCQIVYGVGEPKTTSSSRLVRRSL